MTAAERPYLIPVAVLLAGFLLSVAIYTYRTAESAPRPTGDVSLIDPVSEQDHILGNPGAPVMIVEYSDLDCEYCERSREAMQQIVAEYGADGRVAWAFRHFPILDLYPESAMHAEAAECAASLGGPSLFFRFADAIAAQSPGASRFDPECYGEIAQSLGIGADALSSCISAGTFKPKVRKDFENALMIGADAAPYFVVLIKGAEPISVSGYLPYDRMKELTERALASVSSPTAP